MAGIGEACSHIAAVFTVKPTQIRNNSSHVHPYHVLGYQVHFKVSLSRKYPRLTFQLQPATGNNLIVKLLNVNGEPTPKKKKVSIPEPTENDLELFIKTWPRQRETQ